MIARSVLVVVALAVFAAPAQAAPPFQDDGPNHLSTWYDEHGDPLLMARRDAPGTFAGYRSCPAGGSPCTPLTSARPGPTAAGTTFEAVFMDGGVETTLRTPEWNGRATAVTPPAGTGQLRVGSTLQLSKGSWSGGWAGPGGDFSLLEFVLCREPTGGDCWIPGELTQRWAGWSAFVVEYRYRVGTVFADGAVDPRPTTWRPGGAPTLNAATLLGTVCCVPPVQAPLAVTPAPSTAPTATIRARAVRSHGRLLVGNVTCALRCAVRLTVSGGGRTVVRTLGVQGKASLTVPLRHGKLKVSVLADGKPIASGRTVAR
jgi:hypothetical protein